MKRLIKGCKRMVFRLYVFGCKVRGFSARGAKMWAKQLRIAFRHRKEVGAGKWRWAYHHGFSPLYAKRFGIDKHNEQEFLSQKEYAYAHPLSGKYNKWVQDIVSARMVFKPFAEYLPECLYHLRKRGTELQFLKMPDCPAGFGDTEEEVLRLLEEQGDELYIIPAKWGYQGKPLKEDSEDFDPMVRIHSYVRRHKNCLIVRKKQLDPFVQDMTDETSHTIRVFMVNESGTDPAIADAFLVVDAGAMESDNAIVLEEEYAMASEQITEKEIQHPEEQDQRERDWETPMTEEQEEESKEVSKRKKLLARIDTAKGIFDGGRMIVEGALQDCTTHPVTGKALQGKVPHWDAIQALVDRLGRFVPQLEFMRIDFVVTENGLQITSMQTHPAMSSWYVWNPELIAFLKRKVAQKKENIHNVKVFFHKLKLAIRAKFAATFYPKGLKPYLSIRWPKEVWQDFWENKDMPFSQKMWAYRHGFLSYRLTQYGITKENHEEFISDLEYKWLRHINPPYRIWMEDKITVKYIASDFADCFPSYYYHIVQKNGENKIIPMMDCPEGFEGSYEDIFRLVEKLGVLALKPDEGSHGEGFYKWSYHDGVHYLNHEETTKERIYSILSDINNQYIITEYIQMHEELKRIYSGAVNTVRLIVFKPDGKTPVLGNAYMRFGSKKTGAVDNMGAGGMFAKIDVESGHYYDAKIMQDRNIVDCPFHPDTGVKIEGILPNWEKTKQKILAIAAAIPQLEYFGFDLAITEDGIKLPEINRSPDYPKIEQFTPATIAYLLDRLEAKKIQFGYDQKPCRKLIALPKRKK